MELEDQKFEELNPMFFWARVMKTWDKQCPEVVIKKACDDAILSIVKNNPNIDFVFEDVQEIPDTKIENVYFRRRDRMSYRQWVDSWERTDYLLCDEEDKNYWMQAGLCGVQVIYSLEELKQNLSEIHCLSKLERVENWEKYKKLLTALQN